MRSGLHWGLTVMLAVLAAGGWAAGCGGDEGGDGAGPAADGAAITSPEERCAAYCGMTTELGCEFDAEQCAFFCMDTYRQASSASGTCVVLFTGFLNCALENQTDCVTPGNCLKLNDSFFQCMFGDGCPEC